MGIQTCDEAGPCCNLAHGAEHAAPAFFAAWLRAPLGWMRRLLRAPLPSGAPRELRAPFAHWRPRVAFALGSCRLRALLLWLLAVRVTFPLSCARGAALVPLLASCLFVAKRYVNLTQQSMIISSWPRPASPFSTSTTRRKYVVYRQYERGDVPNRVPYTLIFVSCR
jgi:hypothetical protein